MAVLVQALMDSGVLVYLLQPDEKRLSDDGTNMTSSQANEVETNPPYCPFHVDSRVNVFAFQATAGSSSQINLLDDLGGFATVPHTRTRPRR